jgi:hypothetical protein
VSPEWQGSIGIPEHREQNNPLALLGMKGGKATWLKKGVFIVRLNEMATEGNHFDMYDLWIRALEEGMVSVQRGLL